MGTQMWSVRKLKYYSVIKRNEVLIPPPAAAAAAWLQLCPTLCDPRDGSPPVSPVPGILQPQNNEIMAIYGNMDGPRDGHTE